MRNTLLIQLTDPEQGRGRWLYSEGAGETLSEVREGALSQASGAAVGRRVVVLVPAIEVLLTRARVPSRNRQRVLKAVPYALEEQLAGEVGELHFALGNATDDQYPVAVVARQQMDAWLACCAAAGLQPDAMLPDVLALPYGEDCWGLLLQGDTATVRTGALEGFGCDRTNLGALLALWEDGPVPALRRLIEPGAAPLEGEAWSQQEWRDDANEDPLREMAGQLASLPELDLLQGAYGRSEQLGRLWRPWRASAALLLVGALLGSVSMGLEYHRMGQEQAQLHAQIEQTFRDAFPNAKRVVNPRAQMEQRLAALQRGGDGDDSGFLSLLRSAGPILRSNKGVQVSAASYREGRLDLELTADNLQVLDQLKQTLSQRPELEAEIQSANADADRRVKSRMRISGVKS